MDDLFIEYLETGSGEDHPFFGFVLNRDDAESVTLEPHKEVFPKEGSEYRISNLNSGNILYIPELPEEDDIYYIVDIFGHYGTEVEVKPISNILTGERYCINFKDSLDDKGVYRSICHNEKVMDIPGITPFSDYYIGKQIGRSEEFLVDLL